VAADVSAFYFILVSVLFKKYVQPLGGINAVLPRNQAGLIQVVNVKRLETVFSMLLKPRVGFDLTAFLCLLLDYFETLRFEDHAPSNTLDIANSKARENTKADKHTHAVITVTV
jgi:hypothetical protein